MLLKCLHYVCYLRLYYAYLIPKSFNLVIFASIYWARYFYNRLILKDNSLHAIYPACHKWSTRIIIYSQWGFLLIFLHQIFLLLRERSRSRVYRNRRLRWQYIQWRILRFWCAVLLFFILQYPRHWMFQLLLLLQIGIRIDLLNASLVSHWLNYYKLKLMSFKILRWVILNFI